MKTLTHANPLVVDDLLGDLKPWEPPYEAPARRRSWLKWLMAAAVVAGLAGLAWAGWVVYRAGTQPTSTGPLTTYKVKRGELLVTVTEEGSLESAENVEIKCEVAGGTSIVWIIEDGKEVSKGTELLRLDGSKLKEDVSQQKIEYEKAVAAKIQAAKDYDAAKIAVEEYAQGTFKKDFSEAESKATVARGALRSAENSLQHGERMFRKGYISPLQLEALKTAVEHAKLDLSTAEIARDVLQKFTRPKMMQELESKRDAAAAKRDSEKASLDLQEAKLKRLTTQWEKCTVLAPKAGLVIYANEQMYWGNRDSEIKAGMKVYEEQTILRLPDLSRMRAKVAVHEAKIDQLRAGMRARIRVQDHEFQGAVVSVANRPETSWFMATSKKYPVKVDIDGKSKDLRPGMTAEVEILVDHLQNVISLPVAALAEKAGQTYCCVKKGTALERRNVTFGAGNDKFVEIKQGIGVGEEVVLNPRAALGETGDEPRKQTDVDVKHKFGAAKSAAGAKQSEASKKRSAHDAPAPSTQNAKPKAEKAENADKAGKPVGAKGNH
jgi:multidrug efflux pump subunit AcrA (membrane-fusion protein)